MTETGTAPALLRLGVLAVDLGREAHADEAAAGVHRREPLPGPVAAPRHV